LFSDINLHIDELEKVGIVGVNGSGKTTLFKIILGMVEPDKGKIIFENNARVEWLPQVINDEIPSLEMTVFDFLLLGRPIEKLNNELQNTYFEIAKEENEEKLEVLYKKIDKLEVTLNYWDSYNAESILLKIISGMNITDEMLDQKLSDLSGGQKSKIAFAKLLYSKPELILLDEPTNHLDKETKEYVINYLKNYKGSVFVISHDIEFLNLVTTKTLHLDKKNKSFELFNGNYENFKKLNNEREKNLLNLAEKQQMEEDKLKKVVGLYTNSSGKRKRMAQDREKKLNKLMESKIEAPTKQKLAKINMTINRESTTTPLAVQNLCFKYNKEQVNNIINNLSFSLSKGEKFLIVGENGVGKSTLLKLLIGELTPITGTIEIGNKTDIGYYAQEHELLDNSKTILENFKDLSISERQLRNVLGRFLFFGDDVIKLVGVLSPGERSRVSLAKLSLKGANCLVLDEPTNHLDPETQGIIAETFREYPGTMLVVSHNPEFANNLGIERILLLPSGKIIDYDKATVLHFQKLNDK
ncbi:MAG: ABC-F family ATP-binding cassette domain-containing protein, partial [Bacilli bacterium]